MSKPDAGKNPNWQSSQYSNLIRYVPSGAYYARLRVRGKLIRKSLKTTKISVAKLRLSDLEKTRRQNAEHQLAAGLGFNRTPEDHQGRLPQPGGHHRPRWGRQFGLDRNLRIPSGESPDGTGAVACAN
jgi:hypothetical protein